MFKGLGQMADMAKLMKQAQEMQTRLGEIQEAMGGVIVAGQSGGGMVTATFTAKGEFKALDLDPSLIKADEKEILEDLIVAAVKDAQIKAAKRYQDEMARMTAELGLPPDMKLPL